MALPLRGPPDLMGRELIPAATKVTVRTLRSSTVERVLATMEISLHRHTAHPVVLEDPLTARGAWAQPCWAVPLADLSAISSRVACWGR